MVGDIRANLMIFGLHLLSFVPHLFFTEIPVLHLLPPLPHPFLFTGFLPPDFCLPLVFLRFGSSSVTPFYTTNPMGLMYMLLFF